MKRVLAMLAILMMTGVISAQTIVDTSWSGSGNFEVHFVAGDDAHSDLWTGGTSISGNFYAVDYDDNPYDYEVDTTESRVKASVTGGGYIEYIHVRDDSWRRMYGDAGQKSYSFIGTDDKAEMAFASWTNYARLRDCEYGKPRTSNGHHFEASGDEFQIYHELNDQNGDGASIEVFGSGSAWINLMNSETGWAGNPKGSFKFGKGCGCYKDAKAGMSGVGIFRENAWADNELNIDALGIRIPGDGSDNSAQYHLSISYAGTLNIPDLALDGN